MKLAATSLYLRARKLEPTGYENRVIQGVGQLQLGDTTNVVGCLSSCQHYWTLLKKKTMEAEPWYSGQQHTGSIWSRSLNTEPHDDSNQQHQSAAGSKASPETEGSRFEG